MTAISFALVGLLFGVEESSRLSCGAAAALSFVHLPGKSADPEQIQRLLPDKAEGVSIADVADVLRQTGLYVDIVQFDPKSGPLPRSHCIIHLAPMPDSEVGHFLCLRLLDAKGGQYQRIDPPHPVEVVDDARLLRESHLSGYAIVPRSMSSWIPAGVAVLTSAGFIVYRLFRSREQVAA